VATTKRKSIDFQLDVEKYLLKMGTSIDEAMEEYSEVAAESFDIAEYYRQSQRRRPNVNSPSSLDCPKKMFFGRLGAPREQRIKAQGFLTMLIGYLLGIIFSQLAAAIYGGESEVTVEIPELGVYGHCDHFFMYAETGELILLEFKTLGKSTFEKTPDYYRMQTATYAHGLNADKAYLVVFWMDGRRFKTIPVDIEKWWQESKRRFELVEKHTHIGIPPAEGPSNPYFACASCAFFRTCKPKIDLLPKGGRYGRKG